MHVNLHVLPVTNDAAISKIDLWVFLHLKPSDKKIAVTEYLLSGDVL